MDKTFRNLCCGLILASLFLGCATSSHILTGQKRAAISPDVVKVFSKDPKDFDEIAILTVESSGWTTQGEKEQAIAKLKSEAANLGANGIILTSIGNESSGAVGIATFPAGGTTSIISSSSSTYTTMQARAVFVRSE